MCHFEMIGILLGFLGGIPISGVIFAVLHMAFSNPVRSRTKQLFLGAFVGMVAFEVAAAGAALMAAIGQTNAGHNQSYPLIGFAVPYLAMAALSVLYVRTGVGARDSDG